MYTRGPSQCKVVAMAEYKKEIGVAVAAAVALAVLVGGTAIYLFPNRGAGPYGGPTIGGRTYPTSIACSVQNGSCRIVLYNEGSVNAQAVGCEFQSIYATNGNKTVSTVDLGAGVLSEGTGGPATSITIPGGASVPMYCIVSTQTASPKTDSPADGEILFTNQSLNVQFLGIWH